MAKSQSTDSNPQTPTPMNQPQLNQEQVQAEAPSLQANLAASGKAEVLPDKPSNIEVGYEWVPPNPQEIVNPEPGKHYRWLSKNRVDREGGYTRGWKITTNPNVRVADANAKVLKNSNIPHGTSKTDTTTQFGTMVLAEMPEEMAKARDRHFRNEATKQVEGMIRDEKDRAEAMEKTLRDAGYSKGDVRGLANLVKAYGGVQVLRR